MIHIVFEESNIEALRRSFELDPELQGEIINIQDDYAVGPIANLFTEEGVATRNNWWREILQGGHFDGIADDGHVHDNEDVQKIKALLDDNDKEIVWIWAAQNKHDVSGYYWLMSQLKEYQGRIFILYLNNLPFINEKGNIFYPTHLFQIQAKEFIKAKKLARPITLSEFEVDPDEWARLGNEDKGVRLLEGGKKLVQMDYDYYDAELFKFITGDWLKVHKVFTQFFNKAKETTGDAFLLWRLKKLVEEEKIIMQGDVKNLKDFEVKSRSAETIAAT